METKLDTSFGFIPVYDNGGELRTIIVSNKKDRHWTSPKGHKTSGESDLETARRELFEETGIKDIDVSSADPIKDTYEYEIEGVNYRKTVTYFIGLVKTMTSATPADFKKEIPETRWVTLVEAQKLLFPSSFMVIQSAFAKIRQ